MTDTAHEIDTRDPSDEELALAVAQATKALNSTIRRAEAHGLSVQLDVDRIPLTTLGYGHREMRQVRGSVYRKLSNV